jgi:ribose 5-phosphate isomerase B
MKNIRAGLCHDVYSAHQCVEHDDVNVLCLGARIIGIELAKEIIATFLNAKFSNEERHVRRVGKVKEMENASRS